MSFAIKSGRIIDLVILLASFVVFYIFIKLAEKKMPNLRPIPALDSVEEIAGRAAEMNRPVHFTAGGAPNLGMGALATRNASTLIAGYSVLSKVADACATLKAPFFVTGTNIDGIPLIEEVMGNAYRRAGIPDEFNSTEQIIMSSPYQYAQQYIDFDLFQTRKIAGNIILGNLGASIIQTVETAALVGAVQFVGTSGGGGPGAFVVVVADYVLLGPEQYVAGAILSGESDQLGSVVGNDVLSFFWIVVAVLGYIAASLGSNIIKNFLAL